MLFALFCEARVASSVALCLVTDERETVEISLVTPVYNDSRTIGRFVDGLQAICATMPFEIILVNEGPEDESEMVCS